ncbi:MAG TPA: helix-turn-helix transcriptional regulator, partial [Candidatus Eisenbacteria bacterium]|nr:helix-turn-helix transcriptional regulator [Candidatus Eisenbacteria bacterium]
AMGAAIREIRLGSFMTQTQLEARSGVDQSVISRLERGRPVGLRWQRLAAVLAALGVVRIDFEHNLVRQGGLGPSSVEELWSLSRRRSA